MNRPARPLWSHTSPPISLMMTFLAGCAAVASEPPRSEASTATPVTAASGPLLSSPKAAPAAPRLSHVRVIAMNDFHGYLEPPQGSNGVVYGPPDGTGKEAKLVVGGAAHLARTVATLRAENPNAVVVSAGDLTGASPLASGLFHDEPAILAMNALGLDLEAVGNHDFDHGVPAMRRLALGAQALGDAGAFEGAHFKYLAANVFEKATGKPLFAPYVIKELDGAKVAFIGETLRGTPRIVVPSAVQGLDFRDEATTANDLLPELKAQGVSAFVLVIHEGLTQGRGGGFDGCKDVAGDLLSVLSRLSPEIRVVVSGHTHQPYNCTLGDRVVTSGASYGRLVTAIDLTIDPVAHKVTDIHARNVPVLRTADPDPNVANIVAEYVAKTGPITSKVIGHVRGDWVANYRAAKSVSCESPLGELIADAQAEATSADFALMNPGGVRADLVFHREGREDGNITYGEAFDVQPFGNGLVTLAVKGSQIVDILRAQFHGGHEPRVLLPSSGLSYSYARNGGEVAVENVKVHGKPLEPTATYRVTVNGFLATGGDGFGALKDVTERREGPNELEALTAFLAKHGTVNAPLAPPSALTRIAGDACR